MNFTPRPLIVTCDSCGKSAETWDGEHPDLAVQCDCCPVAHDHTGLGCRTVTITAFAHLTILDVNDLLDALSSEPVPPVFEVRESTPEDGDVFAE